MALESLRDVSSSIRAPNLYFFLLLHNMKAKLGVFSLESRRMTSWGTTAIYANIPLSAIVILNGVADLCGNCRGTVRLVGPAML